MGLWLLCTDVKNYAWEVDSKVGQMIYLMQRVILKQYLVTCQSLPSGLPWLRINVWAYFGGFFGTFLDKVQKGHHA